MTKEQYETLLEALADRLKDKDNEIALKACQVAMLERKLKEAEALKDGGNRPQK